MNLNEKFETATDVQKFRYGLLMKSIGDDIKLTDEQKGSVLWIAGCDPETIANFDMIFFKIRNR